MGFLPPTRGRLGRRIRRQARQCRRQDRIAGGCAGGWSGGSLHVRRAVHGVSRIFWTRNCLARGLDRPFCMDEDPIRNLGRSRGRIELCAVGRVVGWQRARRLPRRLRGSAAQINRGGFKGEATFVSPQHLPLHGEDCVHYLMLLARHGEG